MIYLPRGIRVVLLTVLYVVIIGLTISIINDFIIVIERKIPLLITDPYEAFLFQQLYAAGLTFSTLDICYSILKSYPRQVL